MTDDSDSTNAAKDDVKHITINISLPAALAKLEKNLQRLFDLVSIGVSGVQKVTESEYAVSPFVSSQQLAAPLPYGQAKEEYLYWSLKNAFTEAIDWIGEFFQECRIILGLYRLGAATTFSGDALNQLSTTDRDSFDRKQFPEKIKYLSECCGATFQFEEHVLMLNRARNCLVHRLGVVSPKDTKGEEYLTIKWHAPRLVIIDSVTGEETFLPQREPTKNKSTVNLRIGPIERQFRIGERIRLSPDELNYSMWTFRLFALEILKAIERLQPKA